MSEKKPEESTEAFNLRQIRELEKALESEEVTLIDHLDEKEESLEKIAKSTTVVLDKDSRQTGTFEQMNRGGTKVETTREEKEEKKTDTRSFEIGEVVWDNYNGGTTISYIARNLVEKTNSSLAPTSEKRIKVGQHVKLAALGYKLNGNERVSFVQDEDTVTAESLPYQMIMHEDGYLWAKPSVGQEENAAGLLANHPLSKHLTEEERNRTMIWIQISQMPAEEVIEAIKSHKYGTGTPPSSPEDTEGTLDPDYEPESNARVDNYFNNIDRDCATGRTKFSRTESKRVQTKKENRKGKTSFRAGFELEE